MFKAEIVADSKNEFGNRLTTFVVTFPRIILAEFNTHRMLSRNSASSRAIPFNKMLQAITDNPFIPIAWMKDHKGMQGIEYFTEEEVKEKQFLEGWLDARDNAIGIANSLSDYGLTKQICNRLLEPFMWHTVIVTGTEWENFFALRVHPAAEIHMQKIASMMLETYNASTPRLLKAGEWHIPYHDKIVELIKEHGGHPYFPYPADLYDHEIESLDNEEWVTKYKIKASNMMAARTSYTVVGDNQKPWAFSKYVEEGEKLEKSSPMHASPLEHCGLAMGEEYNAVKWSGNFKGFYQYRKMLEGENATDSRVIKK